MSYAEVTGRNAHQSATEPLLTLHSRRESPLVPYLHYKESLLTNTQHSAAAPVPELEHRTDPDGPHTLIDVDGPHVQSVPNDFPEQPVMTDTQAARLEREAQAALASNKKATRTQHRQEAVRDPINILNAVSTFTLAAVFGFGAYRQSQRPGGFGGWPGVLGWVAGAGALGAANWFGMRFIKANYRKE